VAEEESRAAVFDRWWSYGSKVIAPASLLSTLLFYFGYVSSRAQYRYFGLDVDTVGLSTQDYVMRSPQALLVPLLAICLGAAALLLLHMGVRRHPLPTAAVRGLLVLGLVGVLAGLVLIGSYAAVGDWPAYPLVTPLLLAAGSAAVLYAMRLPGAPGLLQSTDPGGRGLRRGVLACALVAIVACLFWATATLAQWTGLGNGMRTARHLDQLAPVILDTQERLFLTDGGIVREKELTTAEDQKFRYRYRGFRILVQGDGVMFLVPERWSPEASTLMVRLDSSVRVQFRFLNRAP
jgi:hypothetical protein